MMNTKVFDEWCGVVVGLVFLVALIGLSGWLIWESVDYARSTPSQRQEKQDADFAGSLIAVKGPDGHSYWKGTWGGFAHQPDCPKCLSRNSGASTVAKVEAR